MKTLKNTLLASTMVIFSATAFAGSAVYGNYSVHHSNKTVKTATAESKEAAYQLGFEKLTQLKAESGAELSSELALSLGSYQEKNSVTLDDGAYITLQEMINEQGQVVYEGLVNVTYSYSQAN
ncbi:DUF3316 domain-containing protein [Psychromonas sp.]|uniref:DUF3316 domain-containing protein n=1 Tax=Psychromonas sp. TaxID=1884585 RepID=UPI003562D78D